MVRGREMGRADSPNYRVEKRVVPRYVLHVRVFYFISFVFYSSGGWVKHEA